MSLLRSRCAAHMSWSRLGSKTRRPLALPRTAPMARGRSSALWMVDTGNSNSTLNSVSELRLMPRSNAATRRWRQTISVRLIILPVYAIQRIYVEIHQILNHCGVAVCPSPGSRGDPQKYAISNSDLAPDQGFEP